MNREDKLIQILKELKKVEPDPDYSARSRFLILSSGAQAKVAWRAKVFGAFANLQAKRLALAVEIAGLLIVLVLVGTYYLRQTNRNNLVVQANELNNSIQLKLNEIQYLLENQTPANPSDLSNLNELLQKATEELVISQSDLKDNNIEQSLEKIKSVQAIFNEIESKIKEANKNSPQ